MGQGGVDPPTPEGNGFTARRSCRFATDPYVEAQENYDISTSRLTGVRSASELLSHIMATSTGLEPANLRRDRAAFYTIELRCHICERFFALLWISMHCPSRFS